MHRISASSNSAQLLAGTPPSLYDDLLVIFEDPSPHLRLASARRCCFLGVPPLCCHRSCLSPRSPAASRLPIYRSLLRERKRLQGKAGMVNFKNIC